MATTERTKLFSRCNISEDLIKRFTKIKKEQESGKVNLSTTSPTGKKAAALEKFLLSIPLDDDVANFSDTGSNKSKFTNLPLYSDSYEPSFCLPSSGYKSDSEGRKYRIRTCNSANPTPEHSPETKRRGQVRRTRSLNAATVTDRISEIRERIQRSKRSDNNDQSSTGNEINNPKRFGFKGFNTSEKAKDNSLSRNKQASVLRSRSFNTIKTSDVTYDRAIKTSPSKDSLKSNSVSSIKISDINKLRQYFGGTSKRQRNNSISENSNKKLDSNSKSNLRSSSFNTLQEAWEHRRPTSRQEDNVDVPAGTVSTTLSDGENDIVYRRRERRRQKRELLASNEKSDSENESEDSQLTQAALQRFERRSRLAARRQSSLARRSRTDSDSSTVSNDENNNETSSDKTLDSGVFDLALSSLSEGISKLSKRYNSDEFLLDDCLSLKSGYSSTTESLAESLAESTTTFYDSTDDNPDMDSHKKRAPRLKNKYDKTNVKTAVLNSATRFCKTSAKNKVTQDTSDTNVKLTPNTARTLTNHDQTKSTNNLSELVDKVNKTKAIRSPTSKSSKTCEKDSALAVKSTEEKQLVKNENSPSKVKLSKCIPSPLSSNNRFDKKLNNSRKSQLFPKQANESLPARKESIHSKTCNGPERMLNLNSLSLDSHNNKPCKSSVVGPAARKDEVKSKFAHTCLSPTLNKSESPVTIQLKKDGDDKHIKFDVSTKDGTDKNVIKKDQISPDNSININNQDGEANKSAKFNVKTSKDGSSTDTKMEKSNKPLGKFLINRARSSIDETNSRNKLVHQGASIELQISLDDKPKTTQRKSTDKPKLPIPSPSHKPEISTNIKNSPSSTKNNPSLSKGIQCLLLTGETKLSGKVINVSDTSKQVTINEDILEELGSDILRDIQFKYPDYLIPPGEKLDATDFPEILDEKVDPVKLKMENARLKNLLFEVERARAGTVRALLHVNTLLNKVQGENTKLEGDIKVCTQEKEFLAENLKTIQETSSSGSGSSEVGLPGDSVVDKSRRDTVDKSLSIIVESWKKEKKELLSQLNKSKGKEEDSVKAASRLRVQYKKVKEQLEHSNNAFTMTLKNNLDATKRMESELKNSLDEKQQLLIKCNEGNKIRRELDSLKQEMEELKATHEELQDEKEQLENKCSHLEKQKKQLQFEEEELHEQIEHSQEIIEKLTDVEDELKEQLYLEIKDKEYLQECLDETGQILYQLKNNEQVLINDKDTLLDDLEAEVEERESLQTTLSSTMNDHKDLLDRLQNMNNIHITVKESLQQANKKEKNYQEEIEVLTKTNHILHYTLEKEKEEKVDLQEMFDIIETDHKRFKNGTMTKIRDLETKVEELIIENHKLNELKESLEKKCNEWQVNLEQAEEDNASLRQQLSRVEKLKESIEKDLESLRDTGDEMEKNMTDLRKKNHELDVDLKIEKEKVEKLTCNIEETEEMLEKVTRELTDTKKKLDEYRSDYEDLQVKVKERSKRLREAESNLEESTEQRDKYFNRMNFYESETKQLRKKVNEQTEAIGSLQIESQRNARERDTHKRNCDMSVRDFEAHKAKCTETLKKLKDEIIELSNKIVEKDRVAMKQKEHYQDQIDNTQSDLHVLRSMLDSDIRKRGDKLRNSNSETLSDSGSEKMDLNFLRITHDKFRDEFQSHVEKLEDMLKESKDTTDTVTVVQSPMSKIKLEELKQLRNEMFELQAELGSVKRKFANLSAEITSLKLGNPPLRCNSDGSNDELSNKTSDLEAELSSLNELITKIECRHQAVMSRNAILLQKTLTEDDLTAKDLVKKFQVISLEGENKQLKTLLGILKKKYDFNEQELASELKKVNGEEDTLSVSALTNGTGNITGGAEPAVTSFTPRKSHSPRNDSNLRYSGIPAHTSSRRTKNHSFFNELVSTPELPSKKFNRDNLRSSGVSSYSSDEDDYSPPQLPKRYNTLPPRSKRQPRT